MSRLRIAFFGTADFATPSLNALARAENMEVVVVVTQPDKPKGRALKLRPTPVKAAALALGLEVWQPARCREPEFIERLRAQTPDLGVVAAYGQILPQALLDLPTHGCLNVHGSLLPRWRGAAPIQWAILEGDSATGVTIMRVDAGLDTGDMLSRRTTPIGSHDNAQTLHDRLADLGAEQLLASIPGYVGGTLAPTPQPEEGVTYARKILKEDGRLDWSQPASTVWNRIRGLTPWPGAFTHLVSGNARSLLKIWKAEPVVETQADAESRGRIGEILRSDRNGLDVACGEGALRILELQREGGKRLPAAAFLSGHPIAIGQVFDS